MSIIYMYENNLTYVRYIVYSIITNKLRTTQNWGIIVSSFLTCFIGLNLKQPVLSPDYHYPASRPSYKWDNVSKHSVE